MLIEIAPLLRGAAVVGAARRHCSSRSSDGRNVGLQRHRLGQRGRLIFRPFHHVFLIVGLDEPANGDDAMFIVYITFTFSSFWSPVLVHRVGAKPCIAGFTISFSVVVVFALRYVTIYDSS